MFDGNFTFERSANRSQNDFCISNTAGQLFMTSRSISLIINLFQYPSVFHSLLVQKRTMLPEIYSNSWDKTARRQRKIQYDLVDWDAYKTLANLKLEMIFDKMSNS